MLVKAATENYRDWVHQNNVCLLVKETAWVVSLHNLFAIFVTSLQSFANVMETAGRVQITNSFYGVNKLTDNWNLFKKESTRPKLTLYLPSVENMVAYML